jgi:hypothetical protein
MNIILQLEYLIKWKNYDDVSNTWEPEEKMLEDCPSSVKDFEKKRTNSTQLIVQSPSSSSEVKSLKVIL